MFATSNLQLFTGHASTSWPWYVIRASGFVAAGLLIMLMLSGIGQVTGFTYRFIEPVKAWAFHKSLAIALCFSLAIHGGFLLIDKFLPFSLFQILVPFASTYSNGTAVFGIAIKGLGVALGILAMYGILVVVASSLNWINTKQKRWHRLHYLSYLIMLFVFVHALYVGSDLKYGVFRLAWIGLLMIVGLGVVSRILRSRTTIKRSRERNLP